jgi:hypothetical protein
MVLTSHAGLKLLGWKSLMAGLKATARGVHANRGWRKRVVGWEHEGAPVLAAFIGSLRWAGEDVVPLEDVGVAGVGNDVGRWGFSNGGIFFCEALGCCRSRHFGRCEVGVGVVCREC